MASQFTLIAPKKLNKKAIRQVLVDLVEEEIDKADEQFGKTYKTFGNKPTFKKGVKEKRASVEGETLTSGDGSRNNPYPFITKGTSVRYARMTDDFQAKTIPKVIDSGSGRGGVLYIDKRRPRPGIKAREYEETIAKDEQPKFKRRGERAMVKVAKESGHLI